MATKEELIKLTKKIKEQAEILMLDYDKKKHDKARYTDLYNWSSKLLRDIEEIQD